MNNCSKNKISSSKKFIDKITITSKRNECMSGCIPANGFIGSKSIDIFGFNDRHDHMP